MASELFLDRLLYDVKFLLGMGCSRIEGIVV